MTLALDEGALQRNFQGYTTDVAQTLLGLGSSAIGSLAQGYVQNSPSMRQYREAIQNGEFPIAKGIELNSEDRLRRNVIERLMCDLNVDLEDVASQFETALAGFEEEKSILSAMEDDGIVELDAGRIRVTETGRPFVRSVCAVFDTYLASGRGRHSRAV